MQGNRRTAIGLFHLGDGKLALAVGFPQHSLGFGRIGPAAEHRHLVGHNKGRIKTHPELTNKVGVFLLVAR